MKNALVLFISALCSVFSIGCVSTARTPTSAMDSLKRPVFEIGCADVEKVSSEIGEQKFIIEFLNTREDTLDIFWVNYEGVEELYTSISPGEAWSQNTYKTHPWVVREKSGLCIAAYHSKSEKLSNVLIQIE